MHIFTCCKGSSQASAVILNYYGPKQELRKSTRSTTSNNHHTKTLNDPTAQDGRTATNVRREDFLPSSHFIRNDSAKRTLQQEEKEAVQITAGSWGLNESITLTNEDKNSFSYKLKKKRASNELMTSFEKKAISCRIYRAASRRDRRETLTMPCQTLEKHVSIKSFYSEETDD